MLSRTEPPLQGGLDIDLPTTGSVSIGAGNTVAALTFGIIGDNVLESQESLTVTLTAVSGDNNFAIGSSNVLTMNLQDDDGSGNLEVFWGWGNVTNDESDVASAIPLYISRPALTTVSVNVAVTGSVNTSDYGTVNSMVSFSPGVTKSYYYPNFINDTVVEPTESMVLTLNNASGANLISGKESLTYTILDDDSAPSIEIITGTGLITEGSSSTVYFRLSHTLDQAVTFTLSSTDGTASSGNDFSVNSGALTIGAGSLETSISVSALRDGTLESTENFQLSISDPVNATLGSTTSATLAIVDKMPEVRAYFSPTSRYEYQTSSTIFVQITDNVSSKDDILVNLAFSGNATEGSDFTAVSTVKISAGSTFGSASVNIIDDQLAEIDEILTATITSAANANISSAFAAPSMTIIDNDTLPEVSLFRSASTMTEGATSQSLVYVNLSRPYSSNVVANISYTGNATLGTDYTLSAGNAQLTVAPNTFGSGYVTVFPVDDTLIEGNEIITATIASAANATISSTNTQSVTLLDNDGGNFEARLDLNGSSTLTEASSSVSYVRVSLTQAAPQNSTYVISSFGGNATLGDDYTLSTNTVTISAGSSISSLISVTAKSDNLNEIDEMITLGITSATNGLISISNTVNFTIIDSNTTPLVYFPSTVKSFYENTSSQYQSIYLDKVFSGNVTATVSQISGNAVLGTDYTLSGNSVTFTSGSQFSGVTLYPINNTIVDGTRDLVLGLTATGNASTGSGSNVSISILDNDSPTLFLSSSSVAENSSSYQVRVSLDRASDIPVYGNIDITDGTATLGSDYSTKAQTFSILAGSTAQNLYFGLVDDDMAESTETMVASLYQLVNVTTTATNTVSSIIDDDAQSFVKLSSSSSYGSGNSLSITEGNNGFVYLTLDKSTSHDVYVDFTVADITATRTLDYGLNSSGRIRVPAGSTSASFTVRGVDDLISESSETATITISKVVGAQTTAAGNTLAITILDNDSSVGSVLNFTSTASSVTSASNQTISVSLSPALTTDVTYQVAVNSANTTALEGTDYSYSVNTSTISAGNTYGSVVVNILSGNSSSVSSSIQFELLAISGANVGTLSTHTLSIVRSTSSTNTSTGLSTTHSVSLPAYTGDKDYRLMGLPMADLTASSLLSTLRSALGGFQSETTWQVYRFNAGSGNSYEIVNASSNVQSGDGFWVASVAQVDQSVLVTAPSTNTTVTVNLESGWNMISNPFAQSLSKSYLNVTYAGNQLALTSAAQTATATTLWTYTVSGGNATYTSANTLTPGQGAWLYVWPGNTVTMEMGFGAISTTAAIAASTTGVLTKGGDAPESALSKVVRQEPYPPSPPASSSATSSFSASSGSGGGCLLKSFESKESVR